MLSIWLSLEVNNCIKNIISKFILKDKLLFSAVPWSMTGNLNMAKKGTGQWTMAIGHTTSLFRGPNIMVVAMYP